MKPALGRVVHYTLTGEDARKIARRRECTFPGGRENEPAHCAFTGNGVGEGQISPALIAGISGGEINLQVFLDGDDAYWATDVKQGDGPGCWSWPVKDPEGASPLIALTEAQVKDLVQEIQTRMLEMAKRNRGFQPGSI